MTLIMALMVTFSCSCFAYFPLYQLQKSFNKENGIDKFLNSIQDSILKLDALVDDWNAILSNQYGSWTNSINIQNVNHYVDSMNEALDSVKNLSDKAYKYNSLITELFNVRNNLARYIANNIIHSTEKMKKKMGLLWMLENQWRLDDILKLSRSGQEQLANDLRKAQMYLPVNPSRDGEIMTRETIEKKMEKDGKSSKGNESFERNDFSFLNLIDKKGRDENGNNQKFYFEKMPKNEIEAHFNELKSKIHDGLSKFEKIISIPILQTLIVTCILFAISIMTCMLMEKYRHPRMNIFLLLIMIYMGYSIWMIFGNVSMVHDEYVKNCKSFDLNDLKRKENDNMDLVSISNALKISFSSLFNSLSIPSLKLFVGKCKEKENLMVALNETFSPSSYFNDSLLIQNDGNVLVRYKNEMINLKDGSCFREKMEKFLKFHCHQDENEQKKRKRATELKGGNSRTVNDLLEKSDLCIKAMDVLVPDPEDWKRLKRHLNNHKLAMDDFIDNYTVRYPQTEGILINGWIYARECIEHLGEITELADKLKSQMTRVCTIQKKELENILNSSSKMILGNKEENVNDSTMKSIELLKLHLKGKEGKGCKSINVEYESGYDELCSKKM